MPPVNKDEIPEYPFAGPFPGLQSEVAPSQIGNTGFAEVQNLMFRNSTANAVPEFTPLKGGSPDGSPIMGIFDFFEKFAGRVSGVFTQNGMFWYLNGVWKQITPSPTFGSFVSDTIFTNNPPVYSAGVDIKGNDEEPPASGNPAVFRYFQTAVVGYKLYFSNRIIPVQVWDGSGLEYFTADDYSTVQASAPQGVTYFHVCPSPARYFMELDFHLITGNTREIPAANAATACPQTPAGGTPPTTSAPPSAFTQPASQRIHWSAVGDGADWSSFSAGQTDIFNNLGPITGMTRLFQSGYIFQEWGVTMVTPTGQALAPFAFTTMGAYAKGNVFPYSLASFGEQVCCYVAKDDIYVFDGTSSQPIGQHPIQGGRRVGARTRIFTDLFNSYQEFPTNPGLVWDRSAIWGVIMTASRGNTYQAYWLFIPFLDKAWVYNFDEQNWTQLFFQKGRLNGPAVAQFWGPQQIGSSQNFLAVDAMVMADNRAQSVSYLDFETPGKLPTVESINPGDGWYIRSGTLDFDDNRHPHTVNKIRMVLTDVGPMQFYIRLSNEVGYQTPIHWFSIGEGTGKSLTLMVDLQNGITGKYLVWELSGPPGQALQLVEFTPYPVLGGEVMTRCEVAVGPPVLPPTGDIAVSISPGSGSLSPGETQQFTATVSNSPNQNVTWTASNGTIDSSGLFTAPNVSTATTVTIIATSSADSTKSAAVFVSIQPGAVVAVTVAPHQVTLVAGDTQQFTATVTGTANVAVAWSATQGTISSTGLYTAPSVTSTTTATITAVSAADPSKMGQATVTVNPTQTVHVSIAPLSPSINSGGTQQFTATVTGSTNTAVTWSVAPGTISSTGLFTAPTVSVNTSVTVTATSQADSLAVAHVTFTVHPAAAITVAISPTSATLISGGTQTFTATVSNTTNHAVTWTASSGSITTAGVFTAPTVTSTQTITVTATSQADTTKHASVSVSVSPAIAVTVTPTSATITSAKTQQFSASVSGTTNQSVTWTVSGGGTISTSGLYTAPTVSTVTTVTVTATSVANTAKHASATVTVNPAVTGQLDLLNWVLLSSRATQHLVGDPSAPYHVDWIDTDAGYPANFPKGIFWYVKNKLGNPWDVCRYDANYALSHWITENGDSQYTAQCKAANGTTCWLYAKAYKRNTTTGGIHILPRHFTPGSTITINNPTPNNVVRTADCEATTTTINLGPVKSITTGPFNISWGGSIDKGSGTLANGPNYDNVHGVPTIKNQYCFTVDSSQAIGYASVEETYYVQGFGRVAWYYYVRGVFQQKTVNTTLASGGHPALNFPCGPGKSWFV